MRVVEISRVELARGYCIIYFFQTRLTWLRLPKQRLLQRHGKSLLPIAAVLEVRMAGCHSNRVMVAAVATSLMCQRWFPT